MAIAPTKASEISGTIRERANGEHGVHGAARVPGAGAGSRPGERSRHGLDLWLVWRPPRGHVSILDGRGVTAQPQYTERPQRNPTLDATETGSWLAIAHSPSCTGRGAVTGSSRDRQTPSVDMLDARITR